MRKTQHLFKLWIGGFFIMALYQENATASTACEGIRVGIQAGYGLIDSTVKNTSLLIIPNTTDTSYVSGRGAVGGVTLDWNTLVGNSDVLMGLEASFNYITSKGKKNTQGVVLAHLANPADLSTTVLFKRSYDFTGKIGYLFTQSALAYIKLGASMSHWKANSASNILPAKGSIGTNILGSIIGIGAEFPLNERFSVGAEYNYRQYKGYTHTLSNSANGSIMNVNINPTSSAIMLRLNYKMSAVDFTTTTPVKERKRKRPKRPQNASS
jgi:opacity protein-like surface antigen